MTFSTTPVVCLTLAKWETVSGRFGGYLMPRRAGWCVSFDLAMHGVPGATVPSRTVGSSDGQAFSAMIREDRQR